jgi:hypothetical protein
VQETLNGEIVQSTRLALQKKSRLQSSLDRAAPTRGYVTLQAAWCSNDKERLEMEILAKKRDLALKLDKLAKLEEMFHNSNDSSRLVGPFTFNPSGKSGTHGTASPTIDKRQSQEYPSFDQQVRTWLSGSIVYVQEDWRR